MSNCPNCGQPVQPDAAFCRNCGTALTRHQPSHRSRRYKWWVLSVVLLLTIITGGSWFWQQNHQTSPTAANQAASTKSSISESTVTTQRNSTSQNTESATSQSGQQDLALTIGPRESAAAILFYGAKKLGNDQYNRTWEFAKREQRLSVSMHSDADIPSDQRLSHRGQGMVYSIAPGQVDAYIHYTLEADKTVNFYTIDPLETKYLGSASWETIVNYANQHGAANDIHQLGTVAILNH